MAKVYDRFGDPVEGAAADRETRRATRHAAEGDQLHARAHRRGQADARARRPRADDDDLRAEGLDPGEHRSTYDDAYTGATPPPPRRGGSSPRGSRPRGSRPATSSVGGRVTGAANEGAGFVLGLIVYALALNYIRGGPAQVRGWLGAKFLNKPYGGSVATPAPPPAGAAPPDFGRPQPTPPAPIHVPPTHIYPGGRN